MSTDAGTGTRTRPWYARWFSRGTKTAGAGAKTVAAANGSAETAKPAPKKTYGCTLCQFSSASRLYVYDHVKVQHPDELDRNSCIAEKEPGA